MASVDTLMAMGFQAEAARHVSGTKSAAQTSAGSAIGDAAAMVADTVLLTTVGASEGIQLPDKEGIFVVGAGGGNNLKVYPHSASGKINDGSAGAAVTITDGKGGIFVRVDAVNWVAIYS